jgi:uncharacterized SAM-binding protein YcdF (DUF218 family)
MKNERLRSALTCAALGAGVGLFASTLDLQSLLSIWSDGVWIVTLAALTGGACGAVFVGGRRLVFGALIGMEALYAVAAWSPLAPRLARGLSRSDPPGAAADAVYVFNAQSYPNAVLGDTAMGRLSRALDLLKAGRAPRLIVADTPAPEPPFSAAAAKFMSGLGLKTELIALGPVRNTHDEAAAVAALFRKNGWTSVVAVTSRTHSRRACATLEAQGLRVVCAPSEESGFDYDSLSRPDDRIAAFGLAIHERLGLLVYRRRGWIK